MQVMNRVVSERAIEAPFEMAYTFYVDEAGRGLGPSDDFEGDLDVEDLEEEFDPGLN